jgi:hypothetical protein
MPWTTPGTATAGEVLTASFWNTNVRDNLNAVGEHLLTPTSVAGTGVSLSGGKITFSAATAISVNGVFSSLYDAYRINMTTTAGSVDGLWNLRMRLAGTDNSGATAYRFSILQSASAGAWLNLNQSAGTSSISVGYKTTSARAHSIINVYGPAQASPTGFSVLGQYAGNPYTGGGEHDVSTAYDGFSILSASGNFTGTLQVYGYVAS